MNDRIFLISLRGLGVGKGVICGAAGTLRRACCAHRVQGYNGAHSSTSSSSPSTFATSSSGGSARSHVRVLLVARHLRGPSLRELVHELLSISLSPPLRCDTLAACVFVT